MATAIEQEKIDLRAEKENNLEELTGDNSNMSATQIDATAALRADMTREAGNPDDYAPVSQSTGVDPADLPYGLRTAKQSAPVITSALTKTGTSGTPISTYTIAGTHEPRHFTASPLPPGLSLNPTTGAITGTPTVTGTTNCVITARNQGGTDTKTLVFTIS